MRRKVLSLSLSLSPDLVSCGARHMVSNSVFLVQSAVKTRDPLQFDGVMGEVQHLRREERT